MPSKRLKVIIFYGPPGSGKGTQAQIIADKFGLEHFDTGRILERLFRDPKNQDNPVIRREKKKFDDGVLCSTEWITELTKKEVEKIHQLRKGIAFSGALRILYEAEHLFPFLEQLYGKENVYVLRLNVDPKVSIFRNSHRRVCKECGSSIVHTPENGKLKTCPKCNGKLVKRGALDEPETIKVRLKEYKKMTVPIYDFFEKRGVKIINVESVGTVEEVSKRIAKALS